MSDIQKPDLRHRSYRFFKIVCRESAVDMLKV